MPDSKRARRVDAPSIFCFPSTRISQKDIIETKSEKSEKSRIFDLSLIQGTFSFNSLELTSIEDSFVDSIRDKDTAIVFGIDINVPNIFPMQSISLNSS